jgi:hypothetical protein
MSRHALSDRRIAPGLPWPTRNAAYIAPEGQGQKSQHYLERPQTTILNPTPVSEPPDVTSGPYQLSSYDRSHGTIAFRRAAPTRAIKEGQRPLIDDTCACARTPRRLRSVSGDLTS